MDDNVYSVKIVEFVIKKNTRRVSNKIKGRDTRLHTRAQSPAAQIIYTLSLIPKFIRLTMLILIESYF